MTLDATVVIDSHTAVAYEGDGPIPIYVGADVGPKGVQGDQGDQGVQGPWGPSANFWLGMKFQTSTAAPPGVACLKFNSSSAPSATKAYISNTVVGVDQGAAIRNLRAGDDLYFEKDPANWRRYLVAGPTVDGGTYTEVPLTYVGSAGTFAANDPIDIIATVPGPVGPVGPKGDKGDKGDRGDPGKTVLNGTGAPSSALGVDGDYYIDNAAHTIYGPKAGLVWGPPTSLVGPQGATGPRGYSVLNGTIPPTGAIGVDGDFYINTTATTIYGPKTSGAWGSPTSLIGPQGPQGIQGIPGPPGAGGIDDAPFGPTWDGATVNGPSKNAVYDEFVKRPVLAGGNSFTGTQNITGGDLNVSGAVVGRGGSHYLGPNTGGAADCYLYLDNINYYNSLVFRCWRAGLTGTPVIDATILSGSGSGLYLAGYPDVQMRCGAAGSDIARLHAHANGVQLFGNQFAIGDQSGPSGSSNFTDLVCLGAYIDLAFKHYNADGSLNNESGDLLGYSGNGLYVWGTPNLILRTGAAQDSQIWARNSPWEVRLQSKGTAAPSLVLDGAAGAYYPTLQYNSNGALLGQIQGIGIGGYGLTHYSDIHRFFNLAGTTEFFQLDSTGLNLKSGSFKVAGVPIGGGGGLSDGDKGDVSVSGGGTVLTVESASGAAGVFAVTTTLRATGGAWIGTSAGQLVAYGEAVNGAVLAGQGSTNDVTIGNGAGTPVFTIPHSSTNAVFGGLVLTQASAAGGAGLRLPHGAAPTAPVNGDIWTTSAALLYRINGATLTSAVLEGNTFTGKNTTVASAAGGAGFNLPHGAAPTAPVNGDLWTTTTGIFARINGVTKTNAFTDSNITGSAGSVANALTLNNAGAGAASGTTFDGSVARTISYNTIGATRAGTITAGDLTMNTARLLGRTTAAAGAVEEITAGATLSLAAGSLGVASVPNALTINSGGAGVASGGTFNGAAAITLSWNSVGAAPDTPRTQAAAADSITPTFSNDVVTRLAAGGAITLNNPTGTAVDSWGLVIKLRAAAIQTISYGTQWRAVGVTLPTATVANKLIILGAIYNSTDTKWDVVAVAQEA